MTAEAITRELGIVEVPIFLSGVSKRFLGKNLDSTNWSFEEVIHAKKCEYMMPFESSRRVRLGDRTCK